MDRLLCLSSLDVDRLYPLREIGPEAQKVSAPIVQHVFLFGFPIARIVL